MNDLMRPALYGAIHPITRITREHRNHESAQTVDIARERVAGIARDGADDVDDLARERVGEIARKRGHDIARQRVHDNVRDRVDIVGPVCETGDCFLRDWPLGPVASGDVLAIWVTGAYGMSQSSNYNARCRPAEVLVEGKRFRLIRRRETLKDLLRHHLLF